MSKNILFGDDLFQMCLPVWSRCQAAHVFPAAKDFDLQIDVLNYLFEQGVTDEATLHKVTAALDVKASWEPERLVLLVDPTRSRVVLTFVFGANRS